MNSEENYALTVLLITEIVARLADALSSITFNTSNLSIQILEIHKRLEQKRECILITAVSQRPADNDECRNSDFLQLLNKKEKNK